MSSPEEKQEGEEGTPLWRLTSDLRQAGAPGVEWLERHVVDGTFRATWLAAAEPLDVWRLLYQLGDVPRLIRLSQVSAETVAPLLMAHPLIGPKLDQTWPWLTGATGDPAAIAPARSAIRRACDERSLTLAQSCAVVVASSALELVARRLDGTLTPDAASTLALDAVEQTIDAFLVDARESAYQRLQAAGVDEVQAERVALLAADCAEELCAAELAARITAAVECPAIDDLTAD